MFLSQFHSTHRQRFGCIAALMLPVCLAGCEQPQAVPATTAASEPTAQVRPDQYYLNANPSTKEVIEQLDPKTITNVDVLKGKQAVDYTHDATAAGVVLVHTK